MYGITAEFSGSVASDGQDLDALTPAEARKELENYGIDFDRKSYIAHGFHVGVVDLFLRAGMDVSDADMRLIRVWVVGDAVAYVREENNFPGWLSKLERVSGLIRDLRSKEMDVDTLVELGGLLTDARGVSRSLALYVNDRERVQRFEQSIENGLDKEERLLLADYLVRSYESSKS